MTRKVIKRSQFHCYIFSSFVTHLSQINFLSLCTREIPTLSEAFRLMNGKLAATYFTFQLPRSRLQESPSHFQVNNRRMIFPDCVLIMIILFH